jgi:hypothetical protein
MSISLIFNENFNIQLKKSSNQIEGKYNDFFNFRNKKAGINVIESTPNFEMELKIYLKESAFPHYS